MPAKAERVKVEIKESSSNDLRTFDISLTAPLTDFQLTDLLKRRGVIEGLDSEFRLVLREAVERYLTAADALISGLVPNTKSKRKSQATVTANGNSREPRSEALEFSPGGVKS